MQPKPRWRGKKLIVFDLDGTLTLSKADMDAEMGRLLCRLLRAKVVAVIGGAKHEQFQKQFLGKLKCPRERLKNLFIFPTTSTSFYRFKSGRWRCVYAWRLSKMQKRKIFNAFKKAFRDIAYASPQKTYGRVIEDRGTQVTFSALGQKTPLYLKERWNARHDIRPKIMHALRKYLSEFEVRSGGLTSIDVTRKGIDKAYGIREIVKHLGVPVRDMVFVGDALFPGGNDYAAKRTGVTCIAVSGPRETKRTIRFFLKDKRLG